MTDLSAFGLERAVPGGPTTVPAPGSSAASALPSPPIPGFNRLRIDVVLLADVLLPPRGVAGRAELTFARKIKADTKSGAGKTPAKPSKPGAPAPAAVTTVVAIEPAEGTLKLSWYKRGHATMRAALAQFHPGAGPFTISHDSADFYNVSSVHIEAWEDGIKWDQFQVASLTIKLKEIPLAAGAGQLLLFKGKSDASVKVETSGLGPNEVSRWQAFLVAQGFGALLGSAGVDGKYGETSTTATKAFQAREGAKVDGIVGPETFGKAAKFGYKPPPAVKILGAGGTKTAGAAKDKALAAAIASGVASAVGAGNALDRPMPLVGQTGNGPPPNKDAIKGSGDP